MASCSIGYLKQWYGSRPYWTIYARHLGLDQVRACIREFTQCSVKTDLIFDWDDGYHNFMEDNYHEYSVSGEVSFEEWLIARYPPEVMP